MVDLEALANDLYAIGWEDIQRDKDEPVLTAYRCRGHIHQVELTIWADIPSVSVISDGENDIFIETFGIIARHFEEV